MRLKIITELLFLIPLALTLWWSIYFYSAIIGLSIVSALLYHLHKEQKYFYLDVVFSVILIITNLYFVYLSSFKYPHFHLAVIALVASFYFWWRAQNKNYNFNHSMWHIAIVVITISCILAFIE